MPPPNFNRLARLYSWMEWVSFGPYLMRCRCAFLNECLRPRKALVLGDGDGRFTARILSENPAIRIDAVDASPAMLRSLSRRARPHTARVRTFQADARCFRPANPPYDLIVSHFFLDCLSTEEVKLMATILRDAVSPDCLWIVSEFAIPSNWFGRLVAAHVVWGLYSVFGWLTGLQVRSLPDHHSALSDAGFKLEKRRSCLSGLLISEVWSATNYDSSPSINLGAG